MAHLLRAVSVPLLLVVIVGCGPDTGGFTYRSVSGTVTLDGKPLPKATVAFVPIGDAAELGRASTAVTDESGHFTLTSVDGVRGAVVGNHIVTVSTEVVDPDTQRIVAKESLPARYNRNSQLRFTVPDEGTSEANFELQSK